MKQLIKSSSTDKQFYDVYEDGESDLRTVYFIGTYGGKPKYFKQFIASMVKKSYRVVYLQPITDVLSIGHPEWLEVAVKQANEIIKTDLNSTAQEPAGLVGASLGSYLGLNVITHIKFKKFVVVAGGSPLLEVFSESAMFEKARQQVRDDEREMVLRKQWGEFDRRYKNAKLDHLEVLFIVSDRDEVIKKANLQTFLDSFQQTGVNIKVQRSRMFKHTLQVLSINARSKQIEDFLKS